jgi:hypothetical protein
VVGANRAFSPELWQRGGNRIDCGLQDGRPSIVVGSIPSFSLSLAFVRIAHEPHFITAEREIEVGAAQATRRTAELAFTNWKKS